MTFFQDSEIPVQITARRDAQLSQYDAVFQKWFQASFFPLSSSLSAGFLLQKSNTRTPLQLFTLTPFNIVLLA